MEIPTDALLPKKSEGCVVAKSKKKDDVFNFLVVERKHHVRVVLLGAFGRRLVSNLHAGKTRVRE